jgi:hypothetical protein
MKSNFFGLSIAASALVILFVILLFVPMIKAQFPALIQGFSDYECTRKEPCPEGTFCQSNDCIPRAVPGTEEPVGASS